MVAMALETEAVARQQQKQKQWWWIEAAEPATEK
jgi:hypothetical protein